MTPTDQTSTLEEILGGSLPTTKHSGGRYLKGYMIRHVSTSLTANRFISMLYHLSWQPSSTTTSYTFIPHDHSILKSWKKNKMIFLKDSAHLNLSTPTNPHILTLLLPGFVIGQL